MVSDRGVVSRWKALLLVALLAVACKGPSTVQCDAMLDRYLDMTEDDDPALTRLTDAPRANVRALRLTERRGAPSYAEAERRCTQEVSRNAYDCAMKAPTPNDWEACLTP